MQSVVNVLPDDCSHVRSAVAALGKEDGDSSLLGAPMASKSHHRDDKSYTQQQITEFDDRYIDGPHHEPYRNPRRSEAYLHGDEKGVSERRANLDHHRHGE